MRLSVAGVVPPEGGQVLARLPLRRSDGQIGKKRPSLARSNRQARAWIDDGEQSTEEREREACHCPRPDPGDEYSRIARLPGNVRPGGVDAFRIADPTKSFLVIMKDGKIYKNLLPR